MPKAEQKLNEDFRRLMDENDVWPKKQNFDKWMEGRGGYRNSVYGDMKAGRLVNTKYIIAFVEFLQQRAREGREEAAVNALTSYLQSVGLQSIHECSATGIAVKLFAERDWLMSDGVSFMDVVISSVLNVITPKYVRRCSSEEEVEEVCEWLFVAQGREHHEKNFRLPSADAVEVAEEILSVTLSTYQQQAIKWWKFDKWTVVYVVQGNERIGMTIMLPLTRASYDRFRAGERSFYEVERSDLEKPSPCLEIHGLANKPYDEEVESEPANLSKQSLWTLVYQVAMLTYNSDESQIGTRRVLAHAGTPLNRERMKGSGYKPTGIIMPGSQMEIYERVLSEKRADFFFAAALDKLGRQRRKYLEPPGDCH